jgi:hypothetical protein
MTQIAFSGNLHEQHLAIPTTDDPLDLDPDEEQEMDPRRDATPARPDSFMLIARHRP